MLIGEFRIASNSRLTPIASGPIIRILAHSTSSGVHPRRLFSLLIVIARLLPVRGAIYCRQ
jgi:hypothetical protein